MMLNPWGYGYWSQLTLTRETSKTLAIIFYFQILNSDKYNNIPCQSRKYHWQIQLLMSGTSLDSSYLLLIGPISLPSPSTFRLVDGVGVEQHTPFVPPIFCSVALPTKSGPACLNNKMLLRAGVKCELFLSLLLFPLVKLFSSYFKFNFNFKPFVLISGSRSQDVWARCRII